MKVTAAAQKRIDAGFVYGTVKYFKQGFDGHPTDTVIEYTGWIKKHEFDDSVAEGGKSFFIYYIPKGAQFDRMLTVASRFISMEVAA